MNLLTRAVLGGTGLAAACFGWGLAEASMFTLRRRSVAVLPTGAQPIRVLHVSDVHMLPYQRRKQRWLSGLASLRPDLVVVTGDNMGAHGVVDMVCASFGGLLDLPGVFVFGSNDYYAPKFKNPLSYLDKRLESTSDDYRELPWRDLRDRFLASGWHDLTHQRAELTLRGSRVAFRGTDDAHIKRDQYELVAGPAPAGVDLSIGLTHAPYRRVIEAMARDRVDLLFAGHTHGGQVCVPGHGALVSNCDLPPSLAAGLSDHTVDGHTLRLHVSAGLGTSPYAPYRFARPPEAILLTLEPVA